GAIDEELAHAAGDTIAPLVAVAAAREAARKLGLLEHAEGEMVDKARGPGCFGVDDIDVDRRDAVEIEPMAGDGKGRTEALAGAQRLHEEVHRRGAVASDDVDVIETRHRTPRERGLALPGHIVHAGAQFLEGAAQL